MIDIKQYQEIAVAQSNEKYPNLDTLFIGLSSEVGELMSERMRELRTDREAKGLGEITSELGDIIWYVSVIAHRYGLTLDQIADNNVSKLNNRKEKLA